MSEKEKISRRKFFENVAKYCGAGVAAVGLVGLAKKAGAVADLDTPADDAVYTMRDVQLDQYGEFIGNAPIPKDYFDRDLAKFVDNGKPVKWSHLPPNYYTDGRKSLISIVEATPLDKDLKGDIKKVMDRIGGFGKALQKSDKILIKPNWNTGDPWPQGGTDANFLRALIGVLQDAGYVNLTVGDSCGPWGPTERVYKALGHDVVCKEMGVPLIDFEKLPWMHITNAKAEYLGRFPGGYGPQDGTVGYTAALRDFDKVIYTPVMKTHFLGHITMSLKLSVGILHRADRGGQLHNFNHILTGPQAAEINLPFRPDLVIMDGRRSLIAGGPSHGQLVKPGFILASSDQVANDVMGIKILQEWYPRVQNKITMDAWHVNQIAQAVKLGIGFAKGDSDIKMVIW